MENYLHKLNHIKVWYVPPESILDASTCQNLMSWLSQEERARMQSFRAKRHRHAFMVSHALVRSAIARELDCDPSSLIFETNPYGKPSLVLPASSLRLEFNLSHTEGLCTVALAWQSRLGCDVEHLSRSDIDVESVRRFFTNEESEEIIAHPPALQTKRLLSYWTLKESYIKAEGQGLSMGLDTFYFVLHGHRAPQLMLKHGAQQPSAAWQFKQVTLWDEFLFALAIEPQKIGDDPVIEILPADWIGP